MSNKTLRPSLEPIVTSIGTLVDRPMTKTNDVSQSKKSRQYCQQIGGQCGGSKGYIKGKGWCCIKIRTFKICNLKVAKDYEMITYA